MINGKEERQLHAVTLCVFWGKLKKVNEKVNTASSRGYPESPGKKRTSVFDKSITVKMEFKMTKRFLEVEYPFNYFDLDL